MLTISGYETQYGAGIITSSPSFTIARIALKTHCFAPLGYKYQKVLLKFI